MNAKRLKVVTILGTRPEIIRLSSVIQLLDEHLRHVLVHTGQNYDYELSQVFFDDLGIRKPDHFLGIDASSIGAIYGNTLIGCEKVLHQEQPDAVLILGDTNSSIAAIIAKRMRIPIYHMEAGNRCFDFNTPEEINRRVIDHISDFNLVYTERARQHLLAEGLPARRIYLTGSPLFEVLAKHRSRIQDSQVLESLGLRAREFYLVSIHREENVDDPARLESVLSALKTLADAHGLPLIISTHPRTRKGLAASGEQDDPRLRFCKPFGLFDYLRLQMGARCVVSDSGTISEESAMLGFPAVTLRDAMERPEALDAGSVTMAPLNPPTALLESVEIQVAMFDSSCPRDTPREYEVGNTSQRVLNLIVGTARQSNQWDGIRVRSEPDDDR